MPSSVRSEKLRSPSKEYSFDAVPSLSIRGDESASVNHIDPKVLRRATLKIDFYLIPIIGMFCELSPFNPLLIYLNALNFRSFVFSSEYSCNLSPVNVQTVARSRIERMSPPSIYYCF